VKESQGKACKMVYKKSFNIGITCIGSGVGQSVINSCRLSRLPIKTIGLGMNPFAYGAYDCDVVDYIPAIYNDDYVDALIKKCKQHRIDLVIPGLDDEVLILSRAIDIFHDAGIHVIVSDVDLIELCRDKERMSNDLNSIVDVFVRSYDKDTILEELRTGNISYPLIAKPRGGFASRGIEIILDERDFMRISDHHIIQEIAFPNKEDPYHEYCLKQIHQRINPQLAEISIQLVTDKEGSLIGRIATYNKLNNGVPIEIIPYENEYMWSVIDKLYPVLMSFGLRGPFNFQGRYTDKGLKLFEMNPRFTGITGLRALMGFNEVEACIKAWLNIGRKRARLDTNQAVFGVRQIADKAISLDRNEKVKKLYISLNKKVLKKRKVLLITGTTGYLGRNFVRAAAMRDQFQIYTLDRNKKQAESLFSNLEHMNYFDHIDLEEGELSLGSVDVLVHTAFARSHRGQAEIASSLLFTNEIFTRAVMSHIPEVINISSQSVYGLKHPPLWKENLPPAPETPYAQAKYASELMARSGRAFNNQTVFTSLRLASLSGGQDGFDTVDLVAKLTKNALSGESLRIIGGQQEIERLDVRDAIEAILAVMDIDPDKRKDAYNVGLGKTYHLIEIAEKVVVECSKVTLEDPPEIMIEEKIVNLKQGLDITRITEDANWKPRFSMDEIITSVVQHLKDAI